MIIEQIQTYYPGKSYSNREIEQILYKKDKEISEVLVKIGGKHFLDEVKNSPTFFENLGVENRYILSEPDNLVEWWDKHAGTDPFALEAAKSYEQLMENKRPLTTEDRIIVIANGVDTVSPNIGYTVLSHLQKRNKSFVQPSVISLVGEGCSGFISGLREADLYIKAKPNTRVVVITVEMMATPLFNPWLQPELINYTKNLPTSAVEIMRSRLMGLAIQRYLFGEGCAAALCGDDGEGIKFSQFYRWANLDPDDIHLLELIGTNTKQLPHIPPFGFFNQQPEKLVKRLGDAYFPAAESILSKLNLKNAHFAIHTGSGKILNFVQNKLALSDEQIFPSRYILKNYGNMNATTGAAILENLAAKKNCED